MRKRAPGLMTREMAQHVIDTIKPTVSHNINIMDAHGVIIAAVDPSRVGDHHAGALQAVAAEEPVVVWQRDEASGVRPGVNIPLRYDGTVTGVVGVTGPPDEVRSTAELVALTVELLLAQERQINDEMQRDARAHDCLAALSSGAPDPDALAAKLTALSMPAPWTLSVSLRPDPNYPLRTITAESRQDRLRQANRVTGVVAAELYGAVWTLRSGAPSRQDSQADDDRQITCPSVSNVEQLQIQAMTLRHACAYPGIFPATTGSVSSSDSPVWRWGIASSVVHRPRAAVAQLASTVEALTQEQCRTILAVGDHASLHAAAVQLFIHRNTMAQRLDQIVARTGLDPRIGAELAVLLMGVYARAALGDLHIFGD